MKVYHFNSRRHLTLIAQCLFSRCHLTRAVLAQRLFSRCHLTPPFPAPSPNSSLKAYFSLTSSLSPPFSNLHHHEKTPYHLEDNRCQSLTPDAAISRALRRLPRNPTCWHAARGTPLSSPPPVLHAPSHTFGSLLQRDAGLAEEEEYTAIHRHR